MARGRIVRSLLLAAGWMLLGAAASAQAPDIPPGTGPIPRVKKGGKGGVLVYSEHAPQYRPVLPEEIADLVSRGRLVLDVADLELPEQLPVSQEAAQAPIQVLESGELSSMPSRAQRPLFAPDSILSSEGNKREQGYKVLWNTVGALWGGAVFQQRSSLALFPSDDASGKQIEFSVGRIYPAALGGSAGSAKVLFREKIALQGPEVLKGLSWLTFRFLGREGDYLWASSALIHKVRQLTGSNRSDEIFSGAFSPDSLFVWSGKVEAVVPVVVARRTILVAFNPEPFAAAPGQAPSCVGAEFGKHSLALNRDSRRFPQHPAWVPTAVRFVPRRVWQVDLTSRDPFSLDAVQRVFVDERTQLPVYRMSWGQDARLRHVSIGVIGFMRQGSAVHPWLVGQIIRNGLTEACAIVAAQSLERCEAAAPGLSLEDFDPSAIVEPARPTPAPQGPAGPGGEGESEGELSAED